MLRFNRLVRIIVRILSIIVILAAIAWFINSPDYEPLLAILGAVIAFLVSFLSDEKREPSAEETAREIAETRRVLLEGIYNDVVNNRLAGTLEDEIRAELKLTFQPKAVVNRTGKVDGQTQTIQEDTDVVKIFERAGGKLLILGAPGAGKTTTLLRLAKMLLENAKSDEFLTVPMIFELSEWAQERKPLVEWMPEVVAFRTQSKPESWTDWFLPEKPRILPLLDGLDEVPAEYRAECVQRINEFSAALTMKTVVCSRSTEYEQLGETSRLALNGAIELQPLTDTQIDNYLRELGMKTDALRLLMIEDDALRELARQPLMLNMLVLAYQGQDALESFFTAKSKFEIRKSIFSRFFATRFEIYSPSPTKYKKNTFLQWLNWLAKQMNRYEVQTFYIEDLQPYWLPGVKAKLRFEQDYNFIQIFSAIIPISIIFTKIFGLSVTILFVVMIILLFGLNGKFMKREDFYQTRTYHTKITTIENLKWSLNAVKSGLYKQMVASLVVGFIVSSFIFNINIYYGLFIIFLIVITWLLVYILNKGFIPEVCVKTIPNEGMRLSWRNGKRFMLIYILYGLTLGLAFSSTWGLAFSSTWGLVLNREFGLIWGLALGLWFGLIFGLFNGKGMKAVIQHIVLRHMLYSDGLAPLNYAAFLEECVRRKIMVRSGNGYKFLHRLLQEHIAGS